MPSQAYPMEWGACVTGSLDRMLLAQPRVAPTDPSHVCTNTCAVSPNPCDSTSGSPPARVNSEAHDCPIAQRLIRGVKRSKHMLGDKAYDSAELRNDLDERGTNPVIPNKSNRKQPFRFNKRLYKLRWRIEAAFNRLKDFRRIATRYDKLARNYLASVCLVAALVWWI